MTFWGLPLFKGFSFKGLAFKGFAFKGLTKRALRAENARLITALTRCVARLETMQQVIEQEQIMSHLYEKEQREFIVRMKKAISRGEDA